MNTPALDYLLSVYFHQDFHDDYGSAAGAVEAFIEEDSHLLAGLANEIDARLANSDEDDLRKHATSIGCAYRPASEHGGYRGWLASIAARVRAATSQG